ncbi:hook3, partial [Symbiodinium microadriaticum]
KGQDVSHIICLLELVIGVAVLCDNKAQFIPKIFSLQQDSQVVLKSMVERVMARLYDIDDGTQHGQEDSQFLSSQLKDAQDLIQSQAVELEEIRLTFQEVVTVNTALKQEVEALKEKEFQREVDTDSDRSRAEAAAAVQSHMKVEMEDLRAQVSAMSSELETFRQDNFAMSQRLDENEQIRTRLEVEALQMADELDIARDKAIKLTKAEATIAKYQTKMEEMAALKNQATMDKYLEQIHELETASRSANSTAKMVEKYK